MHLHLVRHAPPLIDTGVPASRWPLDPDRLAALVPLNASGVLPIHAATWCSSMEPKAVQTAELLAADANVQHFAELGEAVRPACWSERAAFEATVERSFARPTEPVLPEWEALDTVRQRLLRALDDRVLPLAAGRGHHDVVLVGHGTAWTVLVSALTTASPDIDAWRAMAMPDHCQLEIEVGRATSRAPGISRARVLSHWGDWRAVGDLRRA